MSRSNRLLDLFGADDEFGSPSGPFTAGPLDVAVAATLPKPAAPPPPPSQTLYLTEAGDTAAISVNDLHQGQIGDCFLIASIGELALTHPSAIANMIHDNKNGTETVTLYGDKTGHTPTFGTTAYKPVTVTINNVFPNYSVNNGATQNVVGNQKEIWPQVIEKAVATVDGGYGAISNGGNPVITMQQLTGHTATWMSSASLTLDKLKSFIAEGDLICMDTYAKSGLPNNLVGSHAYMFEKLTTVNGQAMVQLGNPWGTNQPTLIAFSQLARGIAEVDVGRFA